MGAGRRHGRPDLQLHGDLWSGNVFFDRQGVPVLVDPAAYVGHREVDLAMIRLFGGGYVSSSVRAAEAVVATF